MDIILIDSTLHEIGILISDIDIEVGESGTLNNFQLSGIPRGFFESIGAAGFYIEGTELGGMFEFQEGSTNSDTVTVKGWTWRGLLTQRIIIPPPNEDYRIVTGDANAVLGTLLENVLGGFFDVPETTSGCSITSYQFPLYCNVLSGITGMLAEHDYRLGIHADKAEAGEPISVTVEAVPAQQISGTANEDSPYIVKVTDNHMGINHLVCMGKGELKDRQRVDLFVFSNGQIGPIRYYTGFQERTAYYDYSSAESIEELKKHGAERLKELASSKKVEVSAGSLGDAEVGDKVRASIGGEVIITPITRKIVKISQGQETIEYKTKDEQ